MVSAWVPLAATAFVVGAVIGLVLAAHYHTQYSSPPNAFAVVADAGSSHTDFSVYTWTPTSQTAPVSLVPEFSQQKFSCQINTSISSFSSPADSAAALQNCLNESVAQIPAHELSWTPIFVEATAGMRLLQANDPGKASAIIQAISATVSRYGFSRQSQVAILSGTQEGAYGWITASQLTGDLGSALRGIGPTFGALDLGGASTQITFPPPAGATVQPGDIFNTQLFGNTVNLYTHSYLCFGLNSFTDQYQALLLQNNSDATTVNSPCWPIGYNITLSSTYINGLNNNTCTKSFVTKPSSVSVTLVGTSNSSGCQSMVAQLVAQGAIGVDQPSPVSQFLAFGNGYIGIANFLCLNFPSLLSCDSGEKTWTFGLTALPALVDSICNMTIDQLANYTPVYKNNSGYCFNGKYVLQLFDAYRLNATTTQLNVIRPIADESIGWALGFMLAQTTQLSTDRGPRDLDGSRYDAALAVSSVVLLVSLAVLVLLLAKRLTRRSGYTEMTSKKDHKSMAVTNVDDQMVVA